MTSDTGVRKARTTLPDWVLALTKYGQPDRRKALWQLADTFIPYLALWVLMILMVQQKIPYWATLAVATVASAFLIRIFIFFHDCCHGSFFASSRANRILGYVAGTLVFTPYEDWRYSHALHHATAGNLDRRGIGDVWTLTVDEYLAAPWSKKLAYRVFRNPVIMFGLGPIFMFFIAHRFWHKGARARERNSVIVTNLALLAILVVAASTIGLPTYLMIQLPVMIIAGAVGVWLFYFQHQFDGVYWARDQRWDPIRAALEGSSYYRLPKVLQWMTGNIGLHHIHHLRARIPNYHLQQCYDETPALQTAKPLSIRQSFKDLRLNLWNEQQGKLVSFRSLRALPRQR